jgi:hypothetical protein
MIPDEYWEGFTPAPTAPEIVFDGAVAAAPEAPFKYYHIHNGEVRVGYSGQARGVGGHNSRSPTVRVVEELAPPDKNGVRLVRVEIRDPGSGSGAWVPKQAQTSLFPENWNSRRIEQEIEGAFWNSRTVRGTEDKWEGVSPSGVPIQGFYHTPGNASVSGATTAWPVHQSMLTPPPRIGEIVAPADANGVRIVRMETYDRSTDSWVLQETKRTEFPESWGQRRRAQEVEGAFANSSPVAGRPDQWEGISPSGVPIQGYYDSSGTGLPGGSKGAWPVYQG